MFISIDPETICEYGVNVPTVAPSVGTTRSDLTTTRLMGAQVMADSDNSTTLPFVTRRKIISQGAFSSEASAKRVIGNEIFPDPVLALWHQWQEAHLSMKSHADLAHALEQQLAETVDYPCVVITLADGDSVTAYSIATIRYLLKDSPDESTACCKAEADLVAHQLRWEEAEREIGYSTTVRAEHDAAERATRILDIMAKTSSTTLAGVEAKLDAIVREGSLWHNSSEFPWPQIRAVLSDIVQMRVYYRGGSQL